MTEQQPKVKQEYIFERISQERLKDIQFLYRASFGEEVSIDFLVRKYNTESFGANNLGYIAYHPEGEPAAYYGIFPCKTVIKGKTILCAQSGDTMTHPNHRGKGLFIKLAKETYRLARENGICFVFGFPNDNSYPGFVNKLSWVHKENLNIYKFKIFTFPLAYVCRKVSFLSGLYDFWSSFILKKFRTSKTSFDNPLISNDSGGVLRDELFFEYKNYFPKSIIEINGKSVYVKVSAALRIGDVERCSEAEFLKILKKIKTVAWFLGCYAVYFYYSPGTEYDKYLSSVKKPEKGLAIGYVDFTGGEDPGALKFSQADLDTY